MNLNSNLIARLMLNELSGLGGALQPAGAAPQNLSEMARRQRNQNLTNAMLSAASGLLTPSPNRYPLGTLHRLGAGLGAALQGYNEGAPQAGILDALGMGGGTALPRGDAAAAGRRGAPIPRRAGRTVPAPLAAAASAGKIPGRAQASAGSAVRKPASRPLKLEDFTGTLARRLEHPAVLAGGWKLYGYENESGRPVYMGPGRQLRVYG
jgi:hypothetical protein